MEREDWGSQQSQTGAGVREVLKTKVLIPVKECLSSRMDNIDRDSDGKQAESKSSPLPCLDLEYISPTQKSIKKSLSSCVVLLGFQLIADVGRLIIGGYAGRAGGGGDKVR